MQRCMTSEGHLAGIIALQVAIMLSAAVHLRDGICSRSRGYVQASAAHPARPRGRRRRRRGAPAWR